MFLERAETWNPRDGQAFRSAPWSGVIAGLVLACATGGLIWGALGELGWIGWVVAVPCFLVTLLVIKTTRRAFGPANWVLIVKHSGVAVKIRSYLNSDLPSRDPVVAWIPREEIRAVRKSLGSRAVPGGKRSRVSITHELVALDLCLKNVDTTELAAAIKRERSFRGEGRMQFHHYPVSVPEPGCVRISWSAQNQSLKPQIEVALGLLGESFPIEGEVIEPHVDWEKVEGEELEELVRELVESGERIRAMEILRLRTGLSLRDARDRVDALAGRAPKQAA